MALSAPVTDLGFARKKKKPPNPFSPGVGVSPEEGLARSNEIATSFSPGLAEAQYGGFGDGGGGAGGGFSSFNPSITIPGYDPDYAALLAGDPTVLAAQGDLGAFQGQLGDARKAAIRRAVIAAGLAPGSALGDVDEATIEAAGQNRFSSAAELSRQRDRAGGDLSAALGGRGFTFSGGQAAGGERIQEGFERGTTHLTQALLDQIAGYEGSFVEKLGQVRAQYNALKEAAALRIQQDPRYQPLGESDAILDPSTGLYMTPDGRWYNASGRRVSPPRAGGPTAAAPTPPPASAPPPQTIAEMATIARHTPGFYESDNALAAAAARAGRNFF